MSTQTQQIHRRKSSKDSEEMRNVISTSSSAVPTSPTSPNSTPSVEVTVPDAKDLPSVTISQPPARNRVHSTPLHPQYGLGHKRTPSSPNANGLPPSAGPYRATFQPAPPPSSSGSRQVNGHGRGNSITSPFRTTFTGPSTMGPPPVMNGHSHAHSRTRSISTPFTPASPSPLSSSFPPASFGTAMGLSTSPPSSSLQPHMSPSQSAPETLQSSAEGQPLSPPPTGTAAAAKPSRRHARIHSRNLSVFFPRPESLSHRTISEDGDPDGEGGQELTIPPRDEEASLIPSAGSNVSLPGSAGSRRYASSPNPPITPLGQGFTFGAKPPPGMGEGLISAPRMGNSNSLPGTSSSGAISTSKKRGHHHKHSLSHNFFSFLEPGANGLPGREEDLHTQPTPVPVSPWVPDSAAPSKTSFNLSSASSSPTSSTTPVNGHAHPSGSFSSQSEPRISPAAFTASATQFVLGAWLWVTGQQVGSLACTGLGYWIVFDAFGVALVGVIPGWLASTGQSGTKEKIRRPYGNGRLETVLLFAQAVYLLFSSVYVCKETVEHVLLSAGATAGAEGHHHHHGDEDEGLGIDFPIFMTFITFVTLLSTAWVFENNTKLVHVTGNRIPALSTLLRSLWSPSRQQHLQEAPPSTKLGRVLSNPFVASPLAFCAGIVGVALFLSPAQHRSADLVLATLIALVTFQVAYRACVVLGAVLLQTSPSRGMAGGRMEAFLRAMREVERHPHVLHLPAPHIWQLTPSYTTPLPPSSSKSSSGSSTPPPAASSLVVTLELHVREDLGDEDVLKLTRWAWERCVNAITGSSINLKDGKDTRWAQGEGVPEVTVGVVRG